MYIIQARRKECFKKESIVCIIKHYPNIKNWKLFVISSEKYIYDPPENSFSEVMIETLLYWMKEYVEKEKSDLKLI